MTLAIFSVYSETVHHLFFECCVPTTMWCHLSEIFDRNLGTDFESVARWWINKKNAVLNTCCTAFLNTCCTALMWCTWKMRNDFSFQAKMWRSEKDLLVKLIKTLKNWRTLCKTADLQELD